MKATAVLLTLLIFLSISLMTVSPTSAAPSEGFDEVGEDVFDDWDISRTRASGQDGFYQLSAEAFRPVIVFESLGENAGRAYRLGEQFTAKYPDRRQRAEEIFRFVKDRVHYVPDVDQFQFEEFAQNADELALTIEQKGFARGDCEDSTVLLAVMYKGAGYRSAIVLAPGHTAALVHLPEYKKASILEVEGEPGWFWVEATGRNNPFGWVPEQYKGAKIATYEISAEPLAVERPLAKPGLTVAKTGGGGGAPLLASPLFIVIGLMWLMSMFRRRR